MPMEALEGQLSTFRDFECMHAVHVELQVFEDRRVVHIPKSRFWPFVRYRIPHRLPTLSDD